MTTPPQRIMVNRAGYWVGLPSADELADLEKIKPGLGERAFVMVERQQRHEHILRWLGLATSFFLAAASLLGSLYFLSHGNTAGGVGLSASSAAGIVTTYMSRQFGSGKGPDPVASTAPAAVDAT